MLWLWHGIPSNLKGMVGPLKHLSPQCCDSPNGAWPSIRLPSLPARSYLPATRQAGGDFQCQGILCSKCAKASALAWLQHRGSDTQHASKTTA